MHTLSFLAIVSRSVVHDGLCARGSALIGGGGGEGGRQRAIGEKRSKARRAIERTRKKSLFCLNNT